MKTRVEFLQRDIKQFKRQKAIEVLAGVVDVAIQDIAHHDEWREIARVLRDQPDVLGERLKDLRDEVNKRQAEESAWRSFNATLERETPAPPELLDVEPLAGLKPPTAMLGVCGVPHSALLSSGGVMLLAGPGGVGKSTMAAQIAYGVASGEDVGKIFEVKHKGPVIYASHEDEPEIAAKQLMWLRGKNETEDIKLMSMSNHPLFGPAERSSGDAGFYTQEPRPLPGFKYLWEAADEIKPALIVIDSATDAYVGETSSVPSVATFMMALRNAAKKAPYDVAILMLAHSTKAASTSKETYDVGQVAGSAAWVDKARGVVAMMRENNTDSGRVGDIKLCIPKCNRGPSRESVGFCYLHCPKDARSHGRPMRYDADSLGWTGPALKTLPPRKTK